MWESGIAYLQYGIPWWKWIVIWLFDYSLYQRLKYAQSKEMFFTRGVYDRLQGKVSLCLEDILLSVQAAMASHPELNSERHLQPNFIVNFYYTLIHELLHHCNVEKNGGHEHVLNHEKYEKLPLWLKLLFDDFLRLDRTGDSFTDHPDNK